MMEFLALNAPYIVLSCVLIIWTGIASFLWRLDIKIKKLEQHR